MKVHDLAVVGGGILGLACAISAVRRGQSVILCERDAQARGASVRNFGMVWLIGQPRGERLALGARSRECWLELAREAGFWCEESGSLHLAHHDDEWQVLTEFVASEPERQGLELLDRSEVQRLWPAVRATQLRGALRCATDLRVDPREAIAALTRWLATQELAEVWPGVTVHRATDGEVHTTDGRRVTAREILVCSGDDFRTLYPELFAAAGLTRCKLQMMRTPPQPDGWRLGPTLAAGLSLCHYESFAHCPGQAAVRARLEAQWPEHFRFGVHVLAAQNQIGEVLIGDSHEYGLEFDSVERVEIEALILDYLANILELPDPRVAERWHGTYARGTADQVPFVASPCPGVTVVTSAAGAGMTMSFGLAERVLDDLARRDL